MLKLRHVLSTGAATLVGGGLSLVLALSAARLLSPVGNGHYAQYLLVMNLVFISFNLGIGPASTYHLATHRWTLRQVLRLNLCFAAAVTGGAALVSLILEITPASAQIARMFKVPPLALYAGLASGVLLLCINHVAAILMGVHRYDRANVLNTLRAGLPLPFVLVAGAFGAGESPVIAAQTLAMAAVLATSLLGMPRPCADALEPPKAVGQFLRFGMLAYLSNLLHFVAMRGLLVFVSFYAAPEQVGYFNLALLLLEAMLLLPSAIGQLVFPQSSSAGFDRSLIETLLRVNVYVGVLLAVLITAFAMPLTSFILGPPYASVGTALVHLAPSIVLLSVPRILSQSLSGQGHPGYPLTAAIISTIIGVPLAMTIIPVHGIVGAAWLSNFVAAVTAGVTILGYCRVNGVGAAHIFVPRWSDLAPRAWVRDVPPRDGA